MSDTNQQSPTPLLYQMGLAVGQSVAAVVQQTRQEITEAAEQAIGEVAADTNDLAERVRKMRMDKLLGLGMF